MCESFGGSGLPHIDDAHDDEDEDERSDIESDRFLNGDM